MDPCSNWGYSNYTSDGIGCDRTSAGSGYSKQYPKAWTAKYDDLLFSFNFHNTVAPHS